jgi:DNA mismatch endonuclease (patch repair protein)
MDSISKEKRSGIMRLIKSSDTSLEKTLRSRLWKLGMRYRKNKQSLFGKPDISIANKRLVIFIDSCFWHGCVDHARMPRSNIDYWVNKIGRNKLRDRAVNMRYREKNWTVLRYWEHRIKKDVDSVTKEIIQAINQQAAEPNTGTHPYSPDFI